MIPTFFNDVKDDIEFRKEEKKKWDDMIGLSNPPKTKTETLSTKPKDVHEIRLLNEGAVLFSDGYLRMYLKKGVIRDFYENLSDDYVGYITLGHLPLDAVPLVFGTWTKEDLTLVDIGEGRYALDCKPQYNTKLGIVNDILSQEIPLSVSVEIDGELDFDHSMKLEAPVYESLNISGFSIVGDPANVDSFNTLKNGEEKMDDLLNKIEQLLGNKPAEEDKPEEPETDETAPEETPKAAEETTEEAAPEEDAAGQLAARVEEMSARIETLQKENEDLKSQLDAKKAAEEQLNNRVSAMLQNLEGKLNAAPVKAKKADPIWG